MEVLRATKPGDFCAMVVGTALLNGKHYLRPLRWSRACLTWVGSSIQTSCGTNARRA